MGSFDGALFLERDSTTPLPVGDAVGSYTDTQGGPVWQGPLTPRANDTVQLPAQGTLAQYTTLRGKRGVSGALFWGIVDTQTATARLLGISAAEQDHPSGTVVWAMAFRIEA